MSSVVFVFLTFIYQSFCFGLEPGWIDQFDLTETQISILHKFEKMGKFSDEQLLQFAKIYEKENRKKPVYIPPHTFQDLIDVMDWAEGSSFASFAQFTSYQFDNDKYNAACPNRALFNFGMATGTSYLQMDVLMSAMRTFGNLQFMLSHHPESFEENFLKLVRERKFDIYLSPKEERLITADNL